MTTDAMRAEFDEYLLAVTGRDAEYHERYKTLGIEFARNAWQESARRQAVRDAEICNGIAYDESEILVRVDASECEDAILRAAGIE